jgi:DNA-binding CsgD family transcriptional regulator
MFDLLGLSKRHEMVYLAMLEHPELNVAGLAEHLAIPVDEVREALDVLADLALLRLDPHAGRTRVVRPGAGLTALLTRVESDIAARQRQVDATRAAIAALATAHDDQQRAHEGRVLEGRDAVLERLAELAHSAATECLSFTTGRAQRVDTMTTEATLNRLAVQRGVRIRNVYQDGFRNDPATVAHARRMAELGCQSRTAPALPIRMVIVDQRTALVPIDPNDSGRGAVELSSTGVIAALVALFELIWRDATPFGALPAPDAHGLNPQERELLHLLAAGHTDEAAARKLAVSLRSIQRMMTVLADRLSSASRFQAGVRAAQRNWV